MIEGCDIPLNAKQRKFERDAALVGLLQDCAKRKDLRKGSRIHSRILERGSLKKNIFIGSTLVDLYSKCDSLEKARRVFDELPARDVVSWTALITGYAQYGHGHEALACFERMQGEGHCPNAMTFAGILKACSSIGAADKGKEVHAEIVRKGLLGNDVALSNALVDMYAKCGVLVKAKDVFDEITVRDVVTWNTLIAGYVQDGYSEQALLCFKRMCMQGLTPDPVTLLSILPACGSIGATERGDEIHAVIMRDGLMGNDGVLGTALIDMYVKCGALAKAHKVFGDLPVQDVVSWNVIITGYADVGEHNIVFDLFHEMTEDGIEPSLVTFIIVLNVCSCLGLVEKGQTLFEDMTTRYGMIPTLEHYTCMVGLFGSSGLFHEAMCVIKKSPSCDYHPTWLALLGACRKWVNVDLGRRVFQNAIRLDPKSGAAYVYMISIYAAAGMQEEANRIEAMRLENETWV